MSFFSSTPHPLASLSASAPPPPHPSTAFPPSSASAPFPPAPHYPLSAGVGRGAYTQSPESSSPHYDRAGGHAGEGTASAAGKRKRDGTGLSPAEGGAAGAKKTKTVSCTECKRRKIKCDRRIPCLACCKRGDPNACKWEDVAPSKEPDTQPFALTADMVKLASRLHALEEWANTLPAELRAGVPPPRPQEFVPEVYGSKVKQSTKERRTGEAGRREPVRSESLPEQEEHEEDYGASAAPSRDLSDTEESAAVKLESLALWASQPNSKYRPQDSIPFFDNIPSASAQNTVLPDSSGRAHPPQSAELTSMLTSILAPPIVWEGPWSASCIGFDLCFSLEELKASRSRAMASLWAYLPDRTLSARLVKTYFDDVDFLHAVYHRRTFEVEHERMWEMMDAGRREEIDPMWLAGYCMVLALAVEGLRIEPVNPPLSPEEKQRCHPLVWYACTLRFMQLGEPFARAQVRFIQSTILVGQWLQSSSCVGQASRFLSMLACAIRTAQILGLHQLSDDPSHMPPPDPAWPPNACSVRRETALRLFGILSFLDYMSATTRFRCYILDPAQCSTPAVSNLNIDQLSTTDWRIDPHPRNVFTDSSFEYAKYCLCRASREVLQKLAQSSSSFTYDTVLELDAKYRTTLDELESALPSEGQAAQEPVQRWKRLICLEGAHSRLVRLHRPFMAKHEHSRRCCLESAEKVIRMDLDIIRSTNNAWFAYAHGLAAAICLFSDLFAAIDHGLPEKEIERKKEVLVLAFEVFSRSDDVTSPQLRYVVQTGAKILSGLFMAEEKRRATRAANALVGGKNTADPPAESFAAVLSRLSNEFATPAPARPTSSVAPLQTDLAQWADVIDSAPAASAQAAKNCANSMFANAEPSGFAVPYDLNYAGANAEVHMPAEFFRDVGLGGATGVDMSGSFDFLAQPPMQPAYPMPGVESGVPQGGYPGGPGLDWSFDQALLGIGGDSSKAANALLDQLAGGAW
ncbi:hypothetical protein JCM10207_001101 [Rhodosporidiobolus poonsookiae]